MNQSLFNGLVRLMRRYSKGYDISGEEYNLIADLPESLEDVWYDFLELPPDQYESYISAFEYREGEYVTDGGVAQDTDIRWFSEFPSDLLHLREEFVQECGYGSQTLEGITVGLFLKDHGAVGYAIIGVKGPWCMLYELKVEHAYKGRGFGHRLLDSVEAYALGQGCTYVGLDACVATGSVEFYSSREYYVAESDECAVQMRKRLGDLLA